jgi:hypothetical protein
MDHVKPNYLACKIDISGYFTDTEPGKELLARCGGKIYYSGFFDDSVNTYCASTQPSVWIDVIDLVPETFPEEETASNELWEELMDLHTSDDSSYWSRRDVERWKVAQPDRFKTLDFDFDAEQLGSEKDSERHDEVREYLSGNPWF